MTPDGQFAYVTNNVDGTVSVIGSAQQTVVSTIADVAVNVGGVAASPDGQRVYVADSGGDGVVVIDRATQSELRSIAVGSEVRRVAVTPNGGRVFAATASDVRVIDTATDAVGPVIPVGTSANDINMGSDGRAYVAGGEQVVVIDASTNMVITTIPVPGGVATAVPSPDGGLLYVAASGQDLLVFETNTYTLIDSVVVGASPQALAVTPNGNDVVVANGFDDTVSIVKTNNNKVHKTVAVGDFPTGVAIG